MEPTETTLNYSNEKFKKRLAILGGIVVLLIAAFMLYAILTAATRAPYEQALKRYQVLGEANTALTVAGASLGASSATDEDFAKSVKTAQTALGNVKAENELLGKQEVLQDGEGKALYGPFNTALEKYIAYNADILSSMLVVRPIVHSCSTAMDNIDTTTKSVQAMRDCAADFAAADTVADQDYKNLAASFAPIYTKIADNLEATIALKDPDGADADKKQTLSDERKQIVEELNTVSTTFKTDVQAHRVTVLTTDADKNLEAYLKKNASVIHF